MANIVLSHVTKSFGDFKILDDISLEIKDGEFMCIMGPSGCGKTTLLRIIAGLESQYEGTVLFDGQDITQLSPAARGLAMVFQNYALFPHLKARGNIAFPLKIKKYPQREIDRKVMETTDRIGGGLGALLDLRPDQLSEGYKQSTATGRAIIKDDIKALLLDEPLTNLDAKMRAKAKVELKKLVRGLRATAVYVTQDEAESMALGDRIAVLSEQRIQQVGAPQELYEHPVNTFVASFIGSPPMNLFKGVLRRGEFQGQGFRIGGLEEFFPFEGSCILGFRPEDITVSTAPKAYSPEARIQFVETAPPHSYLELALGDTTCKVKVPAKPSFGAGDRIYPAFSIDRAHLFHPQTRERIGMR
jgi:ABC-type sugar transport system ATPase subunit